MIINIRSRSPKARTLTRFDGTPEIGGFSLIQSKPRLVYGLSVRADGEDGKVYEVMIDRETLARLNRMAEYIAHELKRNEW